MGGRESNLRQQLHSSCAGATAGLLPAVLQGPYRRKGDDGRGPAPGLGAPHSLGRTPLGAHPSSQHTEEGLQEKPEPLVSQDRDPPQKPESPAW